MKNHVYGLLLAVFFSAIIFGISKADMVSHWTFDEGDGSIAFDLVNGNNGEIFGPTWADGVLGGALTFDGIDDYVNIPTIVITGSEFTIAAWAKQLGHGGGIDHQNPIFTQRDDETGHNHCAIGLETELTPSTPYAFASIRSSTGPAQIAYYFEEDFSKWHHYAMTVSNTMLKFYIDGEEVSSTTNVQLGDYTTSIDYINIGRERSNGKNRGFFNGLIDDVRVYDKALSPEEIQSIVPEPTMMAMIGLGSLVLLKRKRH